MKNFQDAGFGKNDLISVSITIRSANKILINILGALKATVSGMSPKYKVVSCNSIIYVSDSVNGFFSLLLNNGWTSNHKYRFSHY